MTYDKLDVAGWFAVDVSVLKGARVKYAEYSYEDYEGSAIVIFSQGGKLFEVHGSHCSCYGLEDQWSPEETSAKELKHRLKEGQLGQWPGIEEVVKRLR